MRINRQIDMNDSLQRQPNVNSRENSELPKFHSYENPLLAFKISGCVVGFFGLLFEDVSTNSSLFTWGISVFIAAQCAHLGCDLLRQCRINNLQSGQVVHVDGGLCIEDNRRLIRIETIAQEHL